MNAVTPIGFRDIAPDEAEIREAALERIMRLYKQSGYRPVETPTLEFESVFKQANFNAAPAFTLFDAAGGLLALRPDVTTQIARMCATRYAEIDTPLKLRYTQRVFRSIDGSTRSQARELTQIGIERIGEAGVEADAEVLTLCIETLRCVGLDHFTVALATVGVLRSLLSSSKADTRWCDEVLSAYHRSDFVRVDTLTSDEDILGEAHVAPIYARAIGALWRIRGGREAIDEVFELTRPLGCEADVSALKDLYEVLCAAGFEQYLLIDFSVVSSFDYYTGFVFEVFAPRTGDMLGSGGRYDHMLAAFGADYPACGFACSLEHMLDGLRFQVGVAEDECGKRPLRIAVPKGSLAPDTHTLLEELGLDIDVLRDSGRQLIIHTDAVDYIIVRPTDAPAFVARGAADCGICGKDSLVEAHLDVVELADLGYGACKFVVARPKADTAPLYDSARGFVRVGTKYPRIARAHFEARGAQVEIVKLHGNIELAPLTGLADCIVDITATGATLRENNLIAIEDVMESTARFFANPNAYRTDERVQDLTSKIESYLSKE